MATVSAGLVKVNQLTVTGTQAGAIQASNLTTGNLDLSGNLGVGGNLTFSLAALYYIVKQTNLADLIKMFDEFEAVIQQTNEAYITYAAYKCEYQTYSLTTEGTSAYTKEFVSNLAKQYGADQPKPLYTYGRLKRDECIDLEVAFFNRITAAQVVWETLEGVSEYERSVAERMFLYMKSWLQFSFYEVRETKGTSNYIKGKADFSDFGTYVCNMLNIPFDSVYVLSLTSMTVGLQKMILLVNIEEREDIAFIADLKILYDHLLNLMAHQIDDFLYGLSLGYKFEKNDLWGVGYYGGPTYAGIPSYVGRATQPGNDRILTAYKANIFTNTPFFFTNFCDTVKSEYTRMLNALGSYILTSGSLFDPPETYAFNTSNTVNWETGNVIAPMDYYPDGTSLETRILSTQIASKLAGFDTFDANTFSFINSFKEKINTGVTEEINTVLKSMKAWNLQAPVSLPLDPSGNTIQWMPNAIGTGVNQSDINNYFKYPYLNVYAMQYNITEIDSSKNIVLDRKHLFDWSTNIVNGVPGKSVFEIAKNEYEIGDPAFPDAIDGLLAYPVGDFTSVGGSNTTHTKVVSWNKTLKNITLTDASLYSVGTVVVIKNYSTGSYQNATQAGNGLNPRTDLFRPNTKNIFLDLLTLSGNSKNRYSLDYVKYRIVDVSGNNVKVCYDSDTSNNIVEPKIDSTSRYATPYGNTTRGQIANFYMRPWSEPILLSDGVSNIFNTTAFPTSGSLTNCFLDLAPGSATVLMSWITFTMIRNVRNHQYPKIYNDADSETLRGVPTLGYSADLTTASAGAEFQTKTETGWSHNWAIAIDYGMIDANNGSYFGSYGMDETINGHSVAYALQIARGSNQLDRAVHHSAYYEHLSEWNQLLVRYRAFEMWDPVYEINDISGNAIIYDKGVLDGFRRRESDVQFDVGDAVRICFFDCSGSAQAQGLVEGLGLSYVAGTPTSDYYYVKEVLYDSSGYTRGVTISETKGGSVVDLSGGSFNNAYIVNAMYEMVGGQYPGCWSGHFISLDAISSAVYLTDLENYTNYYGTSLAFWNWARHPTLLQVYGYAGYFTEYYAQTELCPLWGQLHDPPITYTIDDMEENVDNRLIELTQVVNRFNTYDWNLIQVALNEYKASLESQL